MAQGFVRTLNFQESDTGALDRGILDNLGGLNITDDLKLFDGNSKFTSKLDAADYTVANNIVTVSGEGKTAFSDGTKLSFAAAPASFIYTVFNSNGVDTFQVKNAAGATVTPAGILRRSDFVTQTNLSNLSVKRLETNGGISSGISVDSDGGGDVFNSYQANTQVAYIEDKLGLFYYKRSRIPRNYELSTFSVPVKFSGAITIMSSVATSGTVPSDTSPGLFIVDASNPSATAVRAFSDSSNPWSEVSGALHTDEDNAQASRLFFDPVTQPTTPNIKTVNASGTQVTLVATETNVVSSATHKLPVEVNGETYFLLLKV
jgi:hypothetical protein